MPVVNHRRTDKAAAVGVLPVVQPWRRVALYALACAVTIWLGRQTMLANSNVAVLWPSAGIVALWFWGQLRRPATLAASVALLWAITFLLNRLTGASTTLALWFCISNTLLGLMHATALARWLPVRLRVTTPEDYGKLLLICYGGAVAPAAVMGWVSHSVLRLDDARAALSAMSALARNGSGSFLVICVLIHFRSARAQGIVRAGSSRTHLAVGLTAMVILWGLIRTPLGSLALLALLGVHVLLAARCSTRVNSLLMVATASSYVIQMRLGAAPFHAATALGQAAHVQFYVGVLSAVVMIQGSYSALRTQLLSDLQESAEAVDRQLRTTAESEHLYRTAFDRAPLATLVVSLDDAGAAIVAHANLESLAILRLSHEQVIGADALTWVDGQDRPLVQERIRDELHGKGSEEPIEVRVVDAGGRELILRMVTSRVKSAFDPKPYVMILAEDVTVARRAQDELEFRALHDSLTGLPNRVLFMDRLDHALAASGRNHDPVGLLYVDLDGFKPVNDQYGHAAGDELLNAVAARLVAATRPGDTPARLGGDEFAIICPQISQDGLLMVGRRVVQAIGEPFDLPGGAHVTIGASVGAARALCDADRDGLIRRADAAMYAAKHEGRGRVCAAGLSDDGHPSLPVAPGRLPDALPAR